MPRQSQKTIKIAVLKKEEEEEEEEEEGTGGK